MAPAIDRGALTRAQRDVLADALRHYYDVNDRRARRPPDGEQRDEASWRSFVAAELLAMFV